MLVEAIFAWPGLGQLIEQGDLRPRLPARAGAAAALGRGLRRDPAAHRRRPRVARPARPARRRGMSEPHRPGDAAGHRGGAVAADVEVGPSRRPASGLGAAPPASGRWPRPGPGRRWCSSASCCWPGCSRRCSRRTHPTEQIPGANLRRPPARRTGSAPTRSTATSSPARSTASGSTCVVVFVAVPIGAAASASWSGCSSTLGGGHRRGRPAGLRRGAGLPDADPGIALTAVRRARAAHGRRGHRRSPRSRSSAGSAHVGADGPRDAVRRGRRASSAPAGSWVLRRHVLPNSLEPLHRAARAVDVGRGVHRGRDELPRHRRTAAGRRRSAR